jgi:two-component system, NtrC family, sensor kinase
VRQSAEASEPTRARSVVGRRLATGFSVVGLTALAMCTVLLVLLADEGDTARSMQHTQLEVRDSQALATAVREQYIHEARAVIVGEGAHLEDYALEVARVNAHAARLRAELGAGKAQEVDRVVEESRAFDQLFRTQIVPAIDGGDRARVMQLQPKAEALSKRAVHDADQLTSFAERRMANWHIAAIDASRLGLVTGGAGMLLIIVLSVFYTLAIRRSVTRPLGALADAAHRFGGGDFESEVGPIGEGEFDAVARAWDAMTAELRVREVRMLQAERMAAIGQLAAGVAHEINNPIGVIRGYLKTMSADEPSDVLADELSILDDEAAACQRIAEDLLAFARSGELLLETLAVHELLTESVRRFAESGEAQGRAVNADVRPGQVVGDARRLRQVVLNLLRNAVEVSDAPVDLRGAPLPGGGYVFSVEDRGPGVPARDAARIFEPFFTTRKAGSGLGLSVCQGIVRAHGGDIDVTARPGGGSIFRVTLPVEPISEPAT